MFMGLRIIWPILSMIPGLMVAAGPRVGTLEGWSIPDSVYFAFVTGLTIGYGDFAPTMLITRILAIGIGACGVVFSALLAAVAVGALAAGFRQEFPQAGAPRAALTASLTAPNPPLWRMRPRCMVAGVAGSRITARARCPRRDRTSSRRPPCR